ncbi:MAG: uncharacterized protein A8A55_1675 [Amphiamblys sp. WSBS2006]|nr:MAG: uncharacterized protein A8A55_1675 [Amphiamblys sp. WSBS2006]
MDLDVFGDPCAVKEKKLARLGKLQRWIVSALVVDFDAEKGAEITYAFPYIQMSQKTKNAIARTAFPENTHAEEHNYIARVALDSGTNPYMFVHYRRHMDAEAPRGCHQSSLVLLTHTKHFGVFARLARLVGKTFYTQKTYFVLEAVCDSVSAWPDPENLAAKTLPVLGKKIEMDEYSLRNCLSPSRRDAFSKILRAPSDTLVTLWELVLTGTSVMVVGISPETVSATVVALSWIIHPIECCTYCLPYTTLEGSHNVPTPFLLGTTNPKLVPHNAENYRLFDCQRLAFVSVDGTAYAPMNTLLVGDKNTRDPQENARMLSQMTRDFLFPIESFLERIQEGRFFVVEEEKTFSEKLGDLVASIFPAKKTKYTLFCDKNFVAFLRKNKPPLPFSEKITAPNWTELYRHFCCQRLF